MKRIVVTGGRKYSDWVMINDVLEMLAPDEIYVGDATGADSMAYEWAKDREIPVKVFEARWSELGPKAGPIRNIEMLEAALNDEAYELQLMVVAFPGGKGTNSCAKAAIDRNMIVLRVE